MDSAPASPALAELYCRARRIRPADYGRTLFREALYPHARPLAGLLAWLDRRHFAADHEFVQAIGHIRSVGDFALPMGAYIEHPANRDFLRRRLRLRISTRRVLDLVRAAFAAPGVPPRQAEWRGTFDPFPPGRPPPT